MEPYHDLMRGVSTALWAIKHYLQSSVGVELAIIHATIYMQ